MKLLAQHIDAIDGLDIVGQCHNAIEALSILHQQRVDVIFLDIQLPRISGIDFVKSLSHPPKVVFVTDHREFAAEGFELDAVDFLLKPVSFDRFFKAISKLNRIQTQVHPHPAIPATLPYTPYVYLKVDKDMKKVFVEDILYIESWKDYVKVFLTGGNFLLVKQSISAMEGLLSEYQFMRVHRSYMVPADKISGYNGLSIYLGALEIPIGRLYKQVALEKLHRPHYRPQLP